MLRIFKFRKSKFFLTSPLALISLEMYLGSIVGYFISKFLSKKLPSLIFNLGNYKFHLHHWLYSLVVLISGLHYNFLPFPQFSFGFLAGVIFQGIYCYPDWHRIIFRRKND